MEADSSMEGKNDDASEQVLKVHISFPNHSALCSNDRQYKRR